MLRDGGIDRFTRERNGNMKKILLLKRTLAAAIALATLGAMTGCVYEHDHHDDHYHPGDPDHHDDHGDVHVDVQGDDHH
jgi:hypothetical protein